MIHFAKRYVFFKNSCTLDIKMNGSPEKVMENKKKVGVWNTNHSPEYIF